jgi:hypothetical protein
MNGVKSCTNKCTRKERMGIILLKAGMWKLRRITKEFDRGRCPLGLAENAKQILLKCPETRNCREEVVCSKWVNINKDITYWKIIGRTNVTKMRPI